MKICKKILVMAMAVLMLVSVSTETKAADPSQQNVREIKVDNEEQLIFENVYTDELGNEVTEKIYVKVDVDKAPASKMSRSGISGSGRYRKETEFKIATGKTQTKKIKCYVEADFKFKNGKATAIGSRGAVTSCPSGVRITQRNNRKGADWAEFRFYAQSNFSSKKLYSVKITAAGDGRIV